MEHDPNSQQKRDPRPSSANGRPGPRGDANFPPHHGEPQYAAGGGGTDEDETQAPPGEGGERTREGGGRSRVLHARISEELHEALSRAAAELRVPVSNLVRNALEDTFALVDNMSVNVRHFVGRAMKEAGEVGAHLRQRRADRAGARESAATSADPTAAPHPEEFAHVIAWQPAILHAAQQCSSCGTSLQPGTRVHAGITASGPQSGPSGTPTATPPVWLCRTCFWRLR